MKFEIFKYKKVKSTNDMAIRLIKKKDKNLGCVFAEIQTKGRGTHGKHWVSQKGNFFGSIFFMLKEKYPSVQEFSIINPVIISEILTNFCEEKTLSFKKPNDLMINGKKICGILQELITFRDKKFLIIGIGINITKNPDILYQYKATNIFKETQNKPAIKNFINLIIKSYEKFFRNLHSYHYLNFKKKVSLLSRTEV